MDERLPRIDAHWGPDFYWGKGWRFFLCVLPWPRSCQKQGNLTRALVSLEVSVSRRFGLRVRAYTPCRAEYELGVGEFA